MRCITTAILAILLSSSAIQAQGLVKGKVYDAKTDSIMSSTTIYNINKKHFVLSAHDGDYAIVADEGDQLVFSATGYVPDTVKVLNYMVDAGFDVTMYPRAMMLKNVVVNGASYQADSLKRREDYADFYDRPKRELVSKTGPSNGFGVAFSPISFFSGKSKEKKTAAELKYQDEQDFVNYTFSKKYVERMTRLHGDSLELFMLRYRPSYEFCRKASSEDLLHYVNDKLTEFKAGEHSPAHKKNE